MLRLCYFYAIIFGNKYCYVGMTTSYKHRFGGHLYSMKTGRHTTRGIQWAYDNIDSNPRFIKFRRVSRKYNYGITEQWYFEYMLQLGYVMLNNVPPKYAVNPALQIDDALLAYSDVEAFKRRVSEASKRNWQKISYRVKISQSLRKALNRPEVRKKRSESLRKYWSTPERKEYARQRGFEIGSRPDVKQAKSDAMILYYSQPGIIEQRRKLQQIAQSKPEVKHKRRISINKFYDNPEAREQQRLRSLEAQNRPEVKAKKRATYAKPEVKAKMSLAARNRNLFKAEYGTVAVYRYPVQTEQYERYMHITFPTKGEYKDLAVVFIWDTRKVLFIVQPELLPTGYKQIHDSHEPLDFSGIISKSKSNKREYYVTQETV